MKKPTKSDMKNIIKANRHVAKCYAELADARQKLWQAEAGFQDCYYKNVKMTYLIDVCSKYPEEKLLNCDGDIFYIEQNDDKTCLGRRVLWNLELSEELYRISEEDFNEFTSYKIEVLNYDLEKENEKLRDELYGLRMDYDKACEKLKWMSDKLAWLKWKYGDE